MGNLAVRVDNLGKLYRMGERRGYSDLRQAITERMSLGLRSLLSGGRKRLPFKDTSFAKRCRWALRDVSFNIRHGDIVGILGDNGSGKTTLLKILARITHPSEGQAEICGQLNALLDVGAGLHGELTGKENIYLNASLIGMTPSDIRRNFDDIVAFAGLEAFIDTPLKHYSSGMCVRLAFSISAHLESDIFLVDEVLAVGDATFQQKCLNKMVDARKTGRTAILVSHDLEYVRQLCTRGIVFAGGRVVFDGLASAAVDYYDSSVSEIERPLSIAQ